MSIAHIEEITFLVLPSTKDKKHVLLEGYWTLLRFINQILSTTLAVDKMLKKINFWKITGVLGGLLYSDPRKVFDGLNAYFKYLLDIFLSEVLQKYKKKTGDGLSYFFQKWSTRSS